MTGEKQSVDAGAASLTVGTYDEGLAWVGRVTEPRAADRDVELGAGLIFASSVQDGNALWWDAQVAQRVAGGRVVPPATLLSWLTPLNWHPDRETDGGAALTTAVPLPGDSMINISSDIEFFDHLRVGDRYQVVEKVEAVSELKRTAAGPGHFLTVSATFTRESGEVVAVQRNVMLRFTMEADR